MKLEIKIKLLSSDDMGEFLTRAYSEGWELMFAPIFSGNRDRSNLMYQVVDKMFLCVFKRSTD